MMKVVSSTYHQLVRYPTPAGAADIREDQTAARTISVVAQKEVRLDTKNCQSSPQGELPREEVKLITVE